MSNEAKCPFGGTHGRRTTVAAQSNANWWPERLHLSILSRHSAGPMSQGYCYAEEFTKFDYAALKSDLKTLIAA